MKKLTSIISFFSIVLFLTGCGPSITVTDAWKAPDIMDSKTDHFVVMARVDDMASRQRFEQEIVKQLLARGVDAVESYNKYFLELPAYIIS